MAQSPIRNTHGEAPHGSWELAETLPSPALGRFIRRYSGWVETSTKPLRRREVPGPSSVLIFNFGAPLTVGVPGGAPTIHRESFLARFCELPAVTEFQGTSTGVQVDLTPLGAAMLAGERMDRVPAPSIGLGELLGEQARLLTEKLEDTSGWPARFGLLDAEIEKRFVGARAPTPSVEWAWQALLASEGSIPIGALSERLGCSPRHLIAGFQEQIGVAPKTAARILRFDRAVRSVSRRHRASLARIAADCGYHDQAHMTREFRALAGSTPARYADGWVPGFLGVSDERVNFIQDPAEVRS